MRKTLAALAVAAFALAGCGTTGEDEATVSNTPAPTTSKTTSSATPTSQTSSETSESEAPIEQPAEAVPAEQAEVQAPTVTGCANHGGTALMSDGSTAYSASCDENAGGAVPGNVSPYSATGSPTFVRCYLADGTALMSDGSTVYMDSCNESAGGPMLLEDGSSIYDHLNTQPAPQQMPGTYKDENGVSQMPDFQYGDPNLTFEQTTVPLDTYMP